MSEAPKRVWFPTELAKQYGSEPGTGEMYSPYLHTAALRELCEKWRAKDEHIRNKCADEIEKLLEGK